MIVSKQHLEELVIIITIITEKAERMMFKEVYFERFNTAVRIVKHLLSVLRFFETANDTETNNPYLLALSRSLDH